LTAAVVVAGNDGGNTTLDRQGRHCYCSNIPLTAAVVVAGNDYGNTTLDRQGRHCYCSNIPLTAAVVAGNDPKPPLTKAEKAKNKEAWKKAEASDKPSAMCARYLLGVEDGVIKKFCVHFTLSSTQMIRFQNKGKVAYGIYFATGMYRQDVLKGGTLQNALYGWGHYREWDVRSAQAAVKFENI
jgi:hypothetical protein